MYCLISTSLTWTSLSLGQWTRFGSLKPLGSPKQYQISLRCYNKDPSHGGLGKELGFKSCSTSPWGCEWASQGLHEEQVSACQLLPAACEQWETGAQAREPLDVTAMQQKWTPVPQWAGDTQSRHSWWHSWQHSWQQAPRVAPASLAEGIKKPALKRLVTSWSAWASHSPGLKRCSYHRAGLGARSIARNCSMRYFR